jgi:outer membrane receptor for ferric coprogen and ferric-rhodotorulic acid
MPANHSRLTRCLRRILAASLVGAALSAQATPVTLALPAQPLGTALQNFASVAGVSVAADSALVSGHQAPALHGTLETATALRTLLAGSGLEAVESAPGVFLIRRQVQAEASTLPTLHVTANQLGSITENSGSYTPGTIATATRLVLSPRQTPQSISVITRQEMDDFNLTSIDEVMAHTPGVSITTFDTERTVYSARGFAINNFQYDGIPMQRDSAYSSGNTLSDMAIYDRIEVLKGATGLLTGAGDPGATINLIRKKPTRELQGHVTLSAGSWDNYRSEVDVSGPLNASGSVRGRGVASYQEQKSKLDHYSKRIPTFYGIVEIDLTPATLLTVGADYQDNKPEGSTWGGIPMFDSNGDFNAVSRSFNPGTHWSNYEQYTRTVFSTLEHNFSNGWVAKLQLNHQINGYDAQLGSIGSGYPDPDDGSGTDMWTGQYIGKTISDAVEVYASGPFALFGREHELVIGGSYAQRQWTNQGYWTSSYDTSVADFYNWNGDAAEPDWANASWQGSNDETTYEGGLYSAVRWNPLDTLKVITGARWSRYSNADGDRKESGIITPYVGAVYDLNGNLSLYASYTSIFNPQSAQDEQGNTLDPLEGYNYEAGLKGEFLGGRLNLSAAVFRMEQDNYAEATGELTPSGGTAYRGLMGVRTDGYEVELSGQLLPGWQAHVGYTHSVPRQDDARVSTETPEDQLTLYSSYRLTNTLPKLSIGGGARWQSKTWAEVYNPVYGTVTHRMEARWLLDAMLRYEFTPALTASFTVKNLLDKKSYTLMSWYGTYTWDQARNMTLSLNYRF